LLNFGLITGNKTTVKHRKSTFKLDDSV